MADTPTYRNSLTLGSMLHEYRLDSVLGAGGFAGGRALVPECDLRAAGLEGARGRQAGSAQAEHSDTLAFKSTNGDHWVGASPIAA